MRIPFIALLGILLFSHAQAQDQLIKLPNPAELEALTRTSAATDSGKSVKTAAVADAAVNDAAGLKEKIAASDAAAAKAAPAKAAENPPPAASDNDDDDLQDVAAKIAARLTALRLARDARPKPKPVVRRQAANAVAREAKPVSFAKQHNLPAHWAYEGEGGPIHWGKLNPAWAACENGSRQSPIDIRDGIKVDLESIDFNFNPARFNVLDTGHTVQVTVGPGNGFTLTGRTYELMQFHFHHPAEERINGRGFPMVLHMVHKDATGRLAVVAALIQEGSANPVVQQVWNDLPLEKNEPVNSTAIIELAQLLPEKREYYTYMGSLTTPPCSEGVLWIVLKEPIQMSDMQIGIFSRLYPMNARPIQAQAGRLIKESN